jgi:hypothetical protein
MLSLRLGAQGALGMARLADAVLWFVTHVIYKPLAKDGLPSARLLYGDYLLDFLYDSAINNTMDRLQMFHNFLTARIIEYYFEPQLEAWCEEAGHRRTFFHFFCKQTWRISARFCTTEDIPHTPHKRN